MTDITTCLVCNRPISLGEGYAKIDYPPQKPGQHVFPREYFMHPACGKHLKEAMETFAYYKEVTSEVAYDPAKDSRICWDKL